MRKVDLRIKDYNEIYTTYDMDSIKPLLDKCRNCSDPFCSNKVVIDNKVIGCPIDIDVKKIISLLKYNLYKEAYAELIKNNPFPEITERVCKGYCETSCVNNQNNNPTEIRDILRTLADYGLENYAKYDVVEKKDKKITIIGSGASGLACADYLVRNGYDVTIYEKNECAGGTLMYGVTNMRLDKKILNKRIELLKEAGVKFIFNSEVTRVISPMDVKNSSDVVVVASGVVKKAFNCKGMGLKNVMYATDYLKKVTKNLQETNSSNITTGKSILVIGAGDTSEEVISYALRENAKMIALIDYKDMPKLKRTTSWPFADDSINYVSEAIKEVRVKTFMDPRSFNMTVKEITGEKEVLSAKICNVKWVDNKPVLLDHEQEFPLDMVIVSVGNIGYEEDLINYFDLDLVNKLVDEHNHKNSNNIFICGDALINNGITALAIKDGITCAKEVIKYLEA